MKDIAKQERKVIPCGVAVIRRHRDFIIAQRRKDDSFGGYWEFPGGKKNPGETFEACAAREALEEVGLEISVGRKIMEIRRPYHEKIIWLNFYLCSSLSGEPRAIECQRARWVDVADLKRFKFPPANDKVIRFLLERFDGLP